MGLGQSQRLDVLMRITHTSNSALARELSFDASYICRIRSGKRGIPTKQPFIEPVAAYLARRIREPLQVQAAEQVLGLAAPLPQDLQERTDLIAGWLACKDSQPMGQLSDHIVHELSSVSKARLSQVLAQRGHHAQIDRGELASAQACYGTGREGRREATLAFLSALAEQGEPQELLLYSDERMEWFTEDEQFLVQWSDLLITLLQGGSTILIVHTLTRDITEMFDAFKNWLPLYLTGRVRSRYIPRIRDGICRRTLFVAPGDECYEGMIVGERPREGDMVVNIARTKNLGNQRSSTADIAVQLTPPRTFTLEEALEYIADDELVEITPQHIRMRKRLLSEIDRRKAYVRKQAQAANN